MPPELSILIFGGLLVAIAATFVELRASLAPASCPECTHCRQVQHEARLREEAELARLNERIWDIEHRDDPERRKRR